ncbi:MAG: sialidase family protein [Desulfobacteraceae bacterium]|jgi:hypothetical protein
MEKNLFLATKNGLIIAGRSGKSWDVKKCVLGENALTSVVARNSLVLAGSKNGILRSLNGGRDWAEANNNLTVRYVRWIVASPENEDFLLVGTEPASIFVSSDQGDHWTECLEVGELRDEHGWYLPYSPQAGCVRGFAIVPSSTKQRHIYAAVEVGGVLVSDDNGQTWQLVEGSDGDPDMNRSLGKLIHPDVHSITVHPSLPHLITAPTGGGLYQSDDGGRNWKCLYRCYCRAAWVDPSDHKYIIFGPADGVSRNGRIEESDDGGLTWHAASAGMEVPWSRHMVERFFKVDEELFAVLSNGELWTSPLSKIYWRRLFPKLQHISSLASTN